MRDASQKLRLGKARGEQNGMAKLTKEDVLEIRRLRTQGVAYRELARRFDVDRTAVKQAALGITWRHASQ